MTAVPQRVAGRPPAFPGAVVHAGVIDPLALDSLPRTGLEQIDGAIDALVEVIERAGRDAAHVLRAEAALTAAGDLATWRSVFDPRWPGQAPAPAPAPMTVIAQLALPTSTVEVQAVAAAIGCRRPR